MIDSAKLRFIAGAGAALFGLVGVCALGVAAVLALEPVTGMVVAAALVGSLLSLLAVICLILLARPETTAEEEMAKIEHLTAEALADLPFDTVKALIEKRPMACLAIAATTGYTLSRDPEAAARNLRRAVSGLL